MKFDEKIFGNLASVMYTFLILPVLPVINCLNITIKAGLVERHIKVTLLQLPSRAGSDNKNRA